MFKCSSNNYSIHLTTSKKENPLAAPNFCMLLRKYLINFKVTNITTFGFERIAMFEFSGNNESHEPVTRKLVVELMGKHSNILLLDEENKIIDSLRHFSKEMVLIEILCQSLNMSFLFLIKKILGKLLN